MQIRTLIPVLMFSVALIGSNSMLLSPVLQDVAYTLATDAISVSWAMASYGAATALSSLLLGGLIDRYGASFILFPVMVLLAAGLLLAGLSQSLWQLCLAQVLAGIAAGVLLPAIYTVAARSGGTVLGARNLSRVLAGWSISLVAGVPVSALLADLWSWRVSYLALLVIAVAILPLLRALQREVGRNEAAVGARYPLKTLNIRGIPELMLIQLLFMTSFYGVYTFFADALRNLHDLSASSVSLVVIVYGMGFGIASFAVGAVMRWGATRVLLGMFTLGVLNYGIMSAAIQNLESAVVVAFIWGAINHLIVNLVVFLMTRCDQQATGSIVALSSTMTYMGAFIGPLLAGVLLQYAGISMVMGAASMMLLVATILLGLFCRSHQGATLMQEG
ncbi:MAG: MFS transporter [Marinobacterium sp.]|nr:MFS transporter [Marinobacterium sp.]